VDVSDVIGIGADFTVCTIQRLCCRVDSIGYWSCIRHCTGLFGRYLDIQPFIVTLAGLFFGRGMTAGVSTDMISIKNKMFLAWANYKIYLLFRTINKRGIYQADTYILLLSLHFWW